MPERSPNQPQDWPSPETLNRIRGGDRSAMGKLIEECQAHVFAAIRNKMRDNPIQDVEDMVQAAFFNLVRNPNGLLIANSPKAYILRCAINAMYDHLDNADNRAFRSNPAAADDIMANHEMDEPSPSEEVESTDFIRWVFAHLSLLSDGERELLRLRFEEGLNFREIGERLGLSENAVQLRMARLMDKLQRWFGDGTGPM